MEKTLKLKKNYEFKKVLTKGKYYSGKYLDVFVKKSSFPINYIGIAVGAKVTNAVNRNRIKRLLTENYRLIENNLKTGYYMVILWKKKADISEATFSNIKEDMIKVFKRIGILEA